MSKLTKIMFVVFVLIGASTARARSMDVNTFAFMYSCDLYGVGHPYDYGWTAFCDEGCDDNPSFNFDAYDACLDTCNNDYHYIRDFASGFCQAGCGCSNTWINY